MRTALKRLWDIIRYGESQSLYPYEKACFDTWRQSLGLEAQAIIDRQLSTMNVIDRRGDGRIVSFLRPGPEELHSLLPDEFLFPLCVDEIAVARVTFDGTNYSQARVVKADIVLSEGYLTFLEFNSPPKPLRAGYAIAGFSSYDDPMRPAKSHIEPMDASDLAPTTQALLSGHQVAELRKPLSAKDRLRQLAGIDACLPQDYCQLMEETGGLVIDGWRIRGLDEICRTITYDANFYVISDTTEAGTLLIPRECQEPTVVVIEDDWATTHSLGQSLLQAITKLRTEKPDKS